MDYAFLHDFVMGLILGSLVFGAHDTALSRNKALRQKLWDTPYLIYGYHVHHSVLGLFLILIGAIFYSQIGRATIGFGVGIIIVHTMFDGRFVFIEKHKKS